MNFSVLYKGNIFHVELTKIQANAFPQRRIKKLVCNEIFIIAESCYWFKNKLLGETNHKRINKNSLALHSREVFTANIDVNTARIIKMHCVNLVDFFLHFVIQRERSIAGNLYFEFRNIKSHRFNYNIIDRNFYNKVKGLGRIEFIGIEIKCVHNHMPFGSYCSCQCDVAVDWILVNVKGIDVHCFFGPKSIFVAQCLFGAKNDFTHAVERRARVEYEKLGWIDADVRDNAAPGKNSVGFCYSSVQFQFNFENGLLRTLFQINSINITHAIGYIE